MQEQLPQHKAYMLSDFGIRLKKMISSQDGNAPMTYAHQDDYYVMGLVERGSGRGLIDFKEVCVSPWRHVRHPAGSGTPLHKFK